MESPSSQWALDPPALPLTSAEPVQATGAARVPLRHWSRLPAGFASGEGPGPPMEAGTVPAPSSVTSGTLAAVVLDVLAAAAEGPSTSRISAGRTGPADVRPPVTRI